MKVLSGFHSLTPKFRGRSFTLALGVFLLLAIDAEMVRAQLYGDGSDGDVTIVGTVSLVSDMDYNNLTVPAVATLVTNGFEVRVNGTLTNMGTIRSGLVSNAGTGGLGENGGFGIHTAPQSGQSGGAGTPGPSGAGMGGRGGGGGGGGGGAWDPVNSRSVAGGDGGNGGIGGRGAFGLTIRARVLDNAGSINANGESGSIANFGGVGLFGSYTEAIFFTRDHAGGGGGGGGGGQGGTGGDVSVIYESPLALGLVQSLGGAGGLGRTGGSGINTNETAGSNQNEENGASGGSGLGVAGNGGTGGRSEIDAAGSNAGGTGGTGSDGSPGSVTVLPSVVCYADTDGDNFGNPAVPVDFPTSCPGGFTSDNTDCDDTNPNISPAQPEILCDGLDNDCNPMTFDEPDADFDTYSPCNGDCDDNNFNVFPGHPEICNGIDDNCDGVVDCMSVRGDVNNDGSESNILDLTFLVDRIFRGGPAAACPVEADVNSDGSSSNILDLTFLVDRIFRGGPATGPC